MPANSFPEPLTSAAIMEMEGPSLDRELAVRVMGWHLSESGTYWNDDGGFTYTVDGWRPHANRSHVCQAAAALNKAQCDGVIPVSHDSIANSINIAYGITAQLMEPWEICRALLLTVIGPLEVGEDKS